MSLELMNLFTWTTRIWMKTELAPLFVELANRMEEWTDEFIRHAQQELVAMVKDWQYDYGPSDEECAAMLMWMVLRL